jgi:hypothetical protein
MKGQTTLCQDSPIKRAIDHNEIGRSSEENAIKRQNNNNNNVIKLMKTTKTEVWL